MSSTEWETPQDFFDTLNSEFHFTIDACASNENAKCPQYWTRQDDTLDRDWSGQVVWMNPPYDKEIWKWMRKAYLESQKGATVVALIQSRYTDSEMWHNWVMKASEWRIVRNRLHFKKNGLSSRSNFPSMVVIYRPYYEGFYPVVRSIDIKGKLL